MRTGAVAVHDLYSGVPRRTMLPTMAGFLAIAIFVIGFGYWANTAMIASAVITSGQFVATGENKVIQHLEGGVIREILVHEGDIVTPGQVLIRLDDTSPNAELNRLVSSERRDEAVEARLAAEIRDQPKITVPASLATLRGDPDVTSMLNEQQLTFEAWRNNLDANVAALQDGIKALQEQSNALATQKQTTERQLQLILEEEKTKKTLLLEGLVRKTEVLALQSAEAGLQGQIGKLVGDMGDTKEQIAKTQQQIIGAKSEAAKTAVEQLHQTQAEIFDLRQRIRAQEDVLKRVNITAPVNGVVVKLRYHTAGGVVEPGKSILEIVPLEDRLIIQVQVQPRDIFHVKVGQQASIMLSALNRRTTPIISGKVIYVSADALPNDVSAVAGQEVYIVRIALEKKPNELRNFEPVPGMPAEVYIDTGQRTFFQYLVQPIKDSMSRAFRES